MVAVQEICVKCGVKFLRGIFPQHTCPDCSRYNVRSYHLKRNGKVEIRISNPESYWLKS